MLGIQIYFLEINVGWYNFMFSKLTSQQYFICKYLSSKYSVLRAYFWVLNVQSGLAKVKLFQLIDFLFLKNLLSIQCSIELL